MLDGASGRLRAASPSGDQPSDPQFSPNGRWLTFAASTPSGKDQLWLARADGTAARPIRNGGISGFLPDSRLVADGHLWEVFAPDARLDVGRVPADLVAWAPDGSAYAFVHVTRHSGTNGSWSATQRLDVSRTLRGAQTRWFSNRVSFTNAGGVEGGVWGSAVVLPARRGILFRLFADNSSSLAADGLPVYELTRPGAEPRDVGTTVGFSVSLGHGAFALTRGPDRYAWLTKSAWLCSARCTAVPTAAGQLSLDPALSTGGSVAYVQASTQNSTIAQSDVHHWYRTHRLWILERGARQPREVPGSIGAANPTWSADGHSLVYVADNGLWLVPSVGSRPVRVASPLFEANVWPNFYGEVDWQSQFAWSS